MHTYILYRCILAYRYGIVLGIFCISYTELVNCKNLWYVSVVIRTEGCSILVCCNLNLRDVREYDGDFVRVNTAGEETTLQAAIALEVRGAWWAGASWACAAAEVEGRRREA